MMAMASGAGKIAMQYLDKSSPTFKKDASVITRADKEISVYCCKSLQKYLKDPSHLLLDEEDPYIAQYLNQTQYFVVTSDDGIKFALTRHLG